MKSGFGTAEFVEEISYWTVMLRKPSAGRITLHGLYPGAPLAKAPVTRGLCREARVLVGCAIVFAAQRRSFYPPDPDRARQGMVRLGVVMKGLANVAARFGAFTERKGTIEALNPS